MYGNVMESTARTEYVPYQQQHDHPGLKTEKGWLGDFFRNILHYCKPRPKSL